MMSRPETLDSLIVATPGLDKDPIALGIIVSYKLKLIQLHGVYDVETQGTKVPNDTKVVF